MSLGHPSRAVLGLWATIKQNPTHPKGSCWAQPPDYSYLSLSSTFRVGRPVTRLHASRPELEAWSPTSKQPLGVAPIGNSDIALFLNLPWPFQLQLCGVHIRFPLLKLASSGDGRWRSFLPHRATALSHQGMTWGSLWISRSNPTLDISDLGDLGPPKLVQFFKVDPGAP